MHEYQRIKNSVVELLDPLGYVECKPDTDLGFCGSMHSIYMLGDKRFLIQWDGEEGFGSVESWEGDDKWVMLEPIVPESSETEFNESLSALCKELRARA